MVLEIQLTTGRRIWTDSLESHVCRENICIKRCLIFVHPWICIKAKSSDFTLMRPTATKETVAMLRSLTSEARQELKEGTRKRNGRGGWLTGHSCLLLASAHLAPFHSPGNLLMDDSSHVGWPVLPQPSVKTMPHIPVLSRTVIWEIPQFRFSEIFVISYSNKYLVQKQLGRKALFHSSYRWQGII